MLRVRPVMMLEVAFMLWRRFAVGLILLALVAGTAAILTRAQSQTVSGVVRDASGGPLSGAVVRERGGSAFVMTGSDGTFRLPVSGRDAQVTAWAPGHYVGGGSAADFIARPGFTLELRPHPVTDNPDYAFISPVLDMDNPSACAHCHRERSGANGGVMPVDEWLRDAHSGAAVNPRFLSLYNGTALDGRRGALTQYRFDPGAGVDVPVAPSLGQDAVGPGFRLDFPDDAGSCAACHAPLLVLADGYAADPNHAAGVAAEGVTCDFCHKISDVRLRPDGLPDPGLPGVLSLALLRPPDGQQVFIGPYDDTPGDDIFSALQTESQVCAACHSGQFWDVKIYDSFGEWLASPYSDPISGQTCQDCHMPPAGVTAFVQLPPDDPSVIPPRDPATIFSHRMPGAADVDLLQATATLNLQAERSGDQVRVRVRVTNSGAGHHIPTDSPLRNMILLVRAIDADGRPLTQTAGPVIPEWGGVGDPADGYYAGQAGVLYAKILADAFTGETPSAAYWRPTRLVSDNRIAALDYDTSVYTFAIPAAASGVTVEARLIFRRAFIDLMRLKGWDTPDILMEQQTVVLP